MILLFIYCNWVSTQWLRSVDLRKNTKETANIQKETVPKQGTHITQKQTHRTTKHTQNPRWGGQIFRTRPDPPWGPPSLPYKRHSVFLGGGKVRPGCGVDHSPLSSTEVKEGGELYLYFSSVLTRPVLGWASPLTSPVSTIPSLFNSQSSVTDDT